jgi:hypothetical protein
MSKESTDRPLAFSVVEDDGENVTIEISEEDYQRDLASGIDEDAIRLTRDCKRHERLNVMGGKNNGLNQVQ